MIRLISVVAIALALDAAPVGAQDTVITVNVASAAVHKGPTNVTPVIGHVPRGTVLPVSRILGSWVKVPWPDAPEGIGYVHVTMGRIGPADDAGVASRSTRGVPRSGAMSAAAGPARTTPDPRMVDSDQPRVKPISHVLGIGGLVGSQSSYGASARLWRNRHVGLQAALSRDAMTSDTSAGRVTSIQFETGVVYALFDRVSDYVWIRPYVGSALSVRHSTSNTPASDLQSPSANGLGFRAFGGSELTFAGLTQFGLSIEAGYRRFQAPFPGFDPSPLSLSIAGHWYIK